MNAEVKDVLAGRGMLYLQAPEFFICMQGGLGNNCLKKGYLAQTKMVRLGKIEELKVILAQFSREM